MPAWVGVLQVVAAVLEAVLPVLPLVILAALMLRHRD